MLPFYLSAVVYLTRKNIEIVLSFYECFFTSESYVNFNRFDYVALSTIYLSNNLEKHEINSLLTLKKVYFLNALSHIYFFSWHVP